MQLSLLSRTESAHGLPPIGNLGTVLYRAIPKRSRFEIRSNHVGNLRKHRLETVSPLLKPHCLHALSCTVARCVKILCVS